MFGASRSRPAASLICSLPLMSSSPMLSRATRGWRTPSTALTSACPIRANCNRCSGSESTLAPRSSIWQWPDTVGMAVQMAGRSTPGRVLSTKRLTAIRAPVLPALTAAWARPSLTILMATRMEESFFWRRATATESSMATSSLAGWTVMRAWPSRPALVMASASGSGWPTRIMCRCSWRESIVATAGTVTARP